MSPPAPDRDCPLCPRLAALRARNRAAFPDWHNAPVPSWGPVTAPILVLGMAPGQRGANRTGRPFTGDHAGKLLYTTLLKYGLAQGAYDERPDDGMTLTGCRVANAVRCVPPANLPEPAEIRACNGFLQGELAAMPQLRVGARVWHMSHLSSNWTRSSSLLLPSARSQSTTAHPLPTQHYWSTLVPSP